MSDSPATNINPEYTKEGFGATSDATHIVSDATGVQGMLDQTLGEILQTNPQAQQIIMQAMHITPEKFEEMRGMAAGSAMMKMTIRDLITNGTVQSGEMTQPLPQKISFLERIKGLFK